MASTVQRHSTRRSGSGTQPVLRWLEAAARACLQHTPSGLAHLDAHLRIDFCNASVISFLNASAAAEIIGKRLPELWPEAQVLQLAVAAEGANAQPSPLVAPNGRDVDAVLTRLGSGEVDGYVLTINERKADTRIAPMPLSFDVRDQFVATLEHELRNPLTPILAWTEVLKQDPAMTSSMRRIVNAIEQNVLQHRTLVEDLLDLACLRSGRMQWERLPVQLHGLLAEVLAQAEHKAREKNVTLVFESEVSSAFISGDRARLHQVFSNLIDNAIKFTPAGGKVNARLTRAGAFIRIDISDSGIGIERGFMDELFKPFMQAHPFSSKYRRGLGLGLALVKELTEAHGGTVEASSDGQNRGSLFSIKLPIYEESANAPLEPATVLQGRNRRVLLVEDRDETREAIRILLESWGLEVVEAADGLQGLQQIAAHNPSLVLCDLSMPVMDGWTMACEVRVRFPDRKIPLIALSGHGTPADVRHSLHCGFEAHLVKPCQAADLLRVLQKYLPVAATA